MTSVAPALSVVQNKSRVTLTGLIVRERHLHGQTVFTLGQQLQLPSCIGVQYLSCRAMGVMQDQYKALQLKEEVAVEVLGCLVLNSKGELTVNVLRLEVLQGSHDVGSNRKDQKILLNAKNEVTLSGAVEVREGRSGIALKEAYQKGEGKLRHFEHFVEVEGLAGGLLGQEVQVSGHLTNVSPRDFRSVVLAVKTLGGSA